MPQGLLDKTTISIQVAQELRRRILAGHYPQGVKLQQEQIAAVLGVSRSPVHVRKPALTLGLVVQPDVIRDLARKPGFRGSGLLARIFFSLPQSLVGSRDIAPPPVPAESTAA